MPALNHAGDFYNAGTEALSSGNLGEAVLFLRAASRLEPRAPDLARNLAIAEARVALERGESGDHASVGVPIALSIGEQWIVAAILLGLGIVGRLRRWNRLGRVGTPDRGAASLERRLLGVAGLAGLAVLTWLLAGAAIEAVFPEAVVLDKSLPLTAASGQPLPEAPALVEGESVRLGAEREGLVEIKLGGTSVGWSRRSGVWQVKDAPRYTPPSSTDGTQQQDGANG